MSEYLPKLLYERIKNLCDQKGITINTMEKEANVSKSTCDNLKKGSSPSIEKIYKIANYFNVTIDYITGKTETPNYGYSITEQEEFLLNSFRNTTEEGRQRIIQNVLNICDEIEKKHTKSDQSNAG